jgi:hypothetical protein
VFLLALELLDIQLLLIQTTTTTSTMESYQGIHQEHCYHHNQLYLVRDQAVSAWPYPKINNTR